MLLLASTSDKLRLVTSAAITVDVHASYVDLNGTTVTPGRQNTGITTATTTDIVSSPASSTMRTVKSLHIRNRHATTTVDITVIHTDGTNAMELTKVSLPAGWHLHYDEGAGFEVLDSTGRSATNSSSNGLPAAVNSLNIVVQASDVTNSNATANTLADVTGMGFSVVTGETYWFYFDMFYTAAISSTGSRWSVNGPAATLLAYGSIVSNGAGSASFAYGGSYQQPSAAGSTSITTGNRATISGFVQPSSSGTLQLQFASEVSSSAIVAKAGSILQWVRTL